MSKESFIERHFLVFYLVTLAAIATYGVVLVQSILEWR
jgi:hypothetical protein